jgi:sirohydrochlorin cobaltochelatase
MEPVPIILAAFGTAAKTRASYAFIGDHIQRRFPEHPIFWAWSSRVIKEKAREHAPDPVYSPREILEELCRRHYPWAVAQSLHLIGGHEFIRLVDDAGQGPIRTSIGLPLLSAPADYQALCDSLAPLINSHPEQAILLIGHGTDHPAWCAYPALQYFLRHHFGPRVFVGVIEGCPAGPEVIGAIAGAGYDEVWIIPLLLVAGMHFQRDLVGDRDDSWMTLLAQANIKASILNQGIGVLPAIGDIFCRHIQDALAIIPEGNEQSIGKKE